MEQKQIEILKQTPELEKDIKLFKLILTPLELFTLKYFFYHLRPVNVREVYGHSLLVIFLQSFAEDSSETKTKPIFSLFVEQLVSGGYGGIYPDPKTRKKVMREVFSNKETHSKTKLEEDYNTQLKKYKGKIPSYDKFKGMFDRFERIGIIYKRTKDGKIILYGLNPIFYNIFKDKREEILHL